ncbi:(2Fe-2S)-binding protein [Candidatus Zixiibacteriota bacterium]
MTEDTIVCRCEDVTYGQIVEAIQAGFATIEEIKRMLRCGMGACQGRTCERLIAQIVAAKTGVPVAQIKQATVRPPAIPTELAVLAGEADEETS